MVVDDGEEGVEVDDRVVMWDGNGNEGVVVRMVKEVCRDVLDGVGGGGLGKGNW